MAFDANAAQLPGGDECEGRLIELVRATRLLGRDPALAMHGAGNTSYKHVLATAAGEARPALFVKASGTDLAAVEVDDFLVLDRGLLLGLVETPALADEDFVSEASSSLLRPSPRRPSIETPLHTVLPQAFVFHTHPNAVLALCNRRDGVEVVAAALGAAVVAVPYAPIGLALGRAVGAAWTDAPQATAFVLMYHGLVTWGPTASAAYQATLDIVGRAEAYLGEHRVRRLPSATPVPTAERERRFAAFAPALQASLAELAPSALAGHLMLDAELDAATVAVLDTPLGEPLLGSAPLTPDCLLRTRKAPLWLDRPTLNDSAALGGELRRAIADYQAAYRTSAVRYGSDPGRSSSSLLPRALVVPGVGIVTVGRDAAEARMVRDIMVQGLRVKTAIWETGGEYRSLSEQEMSEIERRFAASSW